MDNFLRYSLMRNKKINTILIGLGKIGYIYDFAIKFQVNNPESSEKIVTHARAISCHPKFNFVAGIDINNETCKKFNLIYENPTYNNIDSFLNKEKATIDLVIIAVNPHNQPQLIREVLKKINPKVLLIEKPIAISMKETLEVDNILKKHPDLIVCVNYGRRYLPLVQEWKEKIESGELGKFLHGHIIYGKGIITNGAHFLNLAQYWIGKLKLFKTLSKGNKFLDYDSELSFILSAYNDDSFLGVYSVGNENLRAGELDLWFEKGRLFWHNNGEVLSFWPRILSKSPLETHNSLSKKAKLFKIDNKISQYHVMDLIQKIFDKNVKVELPCTFVNSLETMELMDSALSSVNKKND